MRFIYWLGIIISGCKVSDATGTLTITDKALNSGYAPLTSSQEITANTTKASSEFTSIGDNILAYASNDIGQNCIGFVFSF